MSPRASCSTRAGSRSRWTGVSSPGSGVCLPHGTRLTGSAIIRDDGRYFNRQLFVRPTGEVTAYDKRHLFSIGGEGGLFSAGTERVVVEYGGLRLLLLVCYDLRFPVWSRCRNDYDAIVYSASWPESRRRCGVRCSGPGRSRTKPM